MRTAYFVRCRGDFFLDLWSDGTIGDTLKNVSQGLYTLFITDTNNCVEYHQFQLNDPYVISFGI